MFGEWQPIETANKNLPIWAYNGEQAAMKWSEGEGWALWIWLDDTLNDVDPYPSQPTHWIPLPPPPSDGD